MLLTCRRKRNFQKSKKECLKYSSADFKPNKENKFCITITNHRHHFSTEEELYDYLVRFGDINSVVYTDGSEIEDILDSRKEIQVEELNAVHIEVSEVYEEDVKKRIRS